MKKQRRTWWMILESKTAEGSIFIEKERVYAIGSRQEMRELFEQKKGTYNGEWFIYGLAYMRTTKTPAEIMAEYDRQ